MFCSKLRDLLGAERLRASVENLYEHPGGEAGGEPFEEHTIVLELNVKTKIKLTLFIVIS